MRVLIALLLSLWTAPAWAQVPMTGAGKGTPSSGVQMVTPIFNTQNLNPSATAANYTGLIGSTWSAYTSRTAPMPIAGVFSNLRVKLTVAVASGQYVFTLYVNGAATALACTITSSATTCTDTSTVTVAAGDVVIWQSCPGTHSGVAGSCTAGTPTAQTDAILISATFTSTNIGEGFNITGTNGNNPSNSATNYTFFGSPDVSTTWQTTEANISGIVPTAGTIDNLYIQSSAAPGAAKSYAFTVVKNGSDTSLTCSLTGTGSGAGVTTCNDTTGGHAVTVAAGDTISLKSAPSGTPTAAFIGASFRWVPTIAGEAFYSTVGVQALSTGSARFFSAVSPIVVAGETSQAVFSYVPVALTWKKMYAAIDVAPGGSASRAWVNRVGTGTQSDGTITCTITSAITSCSDTSHSYSATVGDILNWKETPASTPAAITLFKTSSVFATQ